jgi:acetolactate synthase regulatory subunit
MSSLVAPADAAVPELRNLRLLLVLDAEPGVLPRVLEVLAKRGLVPDVFRASRDGDAVEVTIEVTETPAAMAPVIEGSLGQIVGLRSLAHVGTGDMDGGVRIAA